MDPDLLSALLACPDEQIADLVELMAPEDAIALLSVFGSQSEAVIPASVTDQALELDAGYVVRPHLRYLGERITAAVEDVKRGISRKLIVSMPPRHGKTELASVYLPLWLLRRDHKTKIGLISHSPNLAATWGRRVRRMVERHGPALGLSIAPDAGAVSEWETVEGGGVMSRSIGQALAGVGFNVLIVDDPVRDFAAAHSEQARQAVWDWWTVNAVTRLEPPSLVIVIATRWHEDDMIGRILSSEHEGDPSEWEQIVLPALAGKDDPLGREPGEPLLSPLIPDETPEQALERFAELKRNVGSYAWSALFQQRPAPAKGAIFDVSWWRFWNDEAAFATEDGRVRHLAPDDLSRARIIDSWDATFKDTKSSDYVVGQRWARLGANRFLLDQRRGRWSFTKTIAKVLDFAESGPYSERVHERLVEDKANGPAIIDTLQDKISGLKPVNPRGSKEARARAVTPEIESGNVYLPDPTMPGYEWVNALIAEARTFPNGEHDDQIDSMTQALDELRGSGTSTITNPATYQRRDGAVSPVTTRRQVTVSRGSVARAFDSRGRGAGGR